MKIRAFFTSLFLALSLFWAYEISSQNLAPKNTSILDKEIRGIATVIDGDTIKIDGKRIRLIGIDAPETKQNCFDENDDEYLCGQVSTDFLKNFADQKFTICKYEKLDIYKRFLAECFVDNISMNKEMIKNGMALIYEFGKTNYETQKLQEQAQEKSLGMWRGKFQNPKDYRKRNRL